MSEVTEYTLGMTWRLFGKSHEWARVEVMPGVNGNEEGKILMAGQSFLSLAVDINWRERVGKG